MTTPVPNYRILSGDAVLSTVEYDLPDFTRGQTVMKTRIIGTPDGDDILRRLVDKRESTKDILRGEL